MLLMYVSVNHGFAKTYIFMLQLCVFSFSVVISCCDNAVLKLWLGLGPETLGLLGRDRVLA